MGWIGVDLDKTLAHFDGWDRGQIGEPIPLMLHRVNKWLAEGKTVKIFTARASHPEEVPKVKAWLAKHGLPDLDVTNIKDLEIDEIWDDKAVGVYPNTGKRTDGRRD